MGQRNPPSGPTFGGLRCADPAYLGVSRPGDPVSARELRLNRPDGGEPVNHGRCVVLAGGDLAAATDLARNASPDTLWTSGVTPVRVTFRPLLPDERCRNGKDNI